jgi:hypothetical protein
MSSNIFTEEIKQEPTPPKWSQEIDITKMIKHMVN